MKLYLLIVIFLCAFYYGIIVFFTKRWNSTFALFWPFFSMIHLVALILLPIVNRAIAWSIIGFCWIVLCTVLVPILRAMSIKTRKKVEYLIILGAQVRGTKISNSLKRRLDAGIEYLEEYPETIVIVSGGQGKGEAISEAEAMEAYLVKHKIALKQILREDISTSTWENLKYSRQLMQDTSASVAIVTNNFHLYRAMKMAKTIGFPYVFGIAATAHPILQVNYLARECIAVLWMRMRKKKIEKVG